MNTKLTDTHGILEPSERESLLESLAFVEGFANLDNVSGIRVDIVRNPHPERRIVHITADTVSGPITAKSLGIFLTIPQATAVLDAIKNL